MSFVDQAAALERQRRVQSLMDRLSTLSEDELKRLDRILGVQVLIEDAISTGFPVSTVSQQTVENNNRALLSGRIETVRSNLTQILGFTPTDSDINELLRLRSIYGDNFSGAIKRISQSINDVQGGIASLLAAIDTGITDTIDTATKAAQQAIDEANRAANAAIQSVIGGVSNIIPAETINSIRSSVGDITSFLNNPLVLVPRLTNLFSDTLDAKIKRIDAELDAISREQQEAARQNATSTVSTENANQVQQNIANALNTPPTNPDPVTEDGTPYNTVPNN